MNSQPERIVRRSPPLLQVHLAFAQQRRLQRLRQAISDRGFASTLWNAARKRLTRLRFEEVWVSVTALHLETYHPKYLEYHAGRVTKWTVRQVTWQELEAIDLSAIEAPFLDRFERWLKRGDLGFGVFEGNRMVGLTLLTASGYSDRDGLRVSVGPDERKLRDMFVAPVCRRTIVPGLLHDAAMVAARREGAHRALGSVLRSNRAQLKNSINGGWKEIRRVRCRKALYILRWSKDVWRADSWNEARTLTCRDALDRPTVGQPESGRPGQTPAPSAAATKGATG